MKQRGNKHKGCEGEFFAMFDAISKGYIVAQNIESDLLGYDFILDDGEQLFRVEVKTSEFTVPSKTTGKADNNKVNFSLTSQTGSGYINKYNHIEWVALFAPRFQKVAWIKKKDIGSKKVLYEKDFEHLQLPENEKLKYLTEISEEFDDKQVNLFD